MELLKNSESENRQNYRKEQKTNETIRKQLIDFNSDVSIITLNVLSKLTN